MACNLHHLSQAINYSLSCLCIYKVSQKFPKRLTTAFLLRFSQFSSTKFCIPRAISAAAITTSSSSFSWDDVGVVSRPEYAPHDSCDLKGFFDKIKWCNRGAELESEFIPFVIEGQIVGYIHNGIYFGLATDYWRELFFMSFADHLRGFHDVFTFRQDNSYGNQFGGHVTLHPMLKAPEERTRAVGYVIKCLSEKKLIPGIRNELYPVSSSFGAPIFFSLERAAAPYFGIKAYGVHMNGYVERDGKKFLWIGKRSQMKPTYPGMLDHLVAGGLPHGISCGENLIKECEEEAGIPRSISVEAISVGAVSYMDIDRHRYKRDVLFCYDLKLPVDFLPKNQDGEVESFRLVPVMHVANVIKRTEFFKPNCSLVIIDFLFRHGFIDPECFGYLDLLQKLKSGDCS